ITLYYIFTFLSGVLVIVTIRHRKIHELVIAVALFAVSYSQYRNVPLFVIYASGLTGQMLTELLTKMYQKKNKQVFESIQNYSRILLVCLALAISARVITNAYYVSDKRLVRFGWGLDRHYVADGAAQFMKEKGIKGRVLNNIGVGSWLGWRLNIPVFIDGRLEVMQDSLYKEFQKSLKPGGVKSLIKQNNADLIIFDYAATMSWQSQLLEIPEWRIIYFDESTAIYAHGGIADHVTSMKFEKKLLEMGLDTATAGTVLLDKWLGQPESAMKTWLAGFFVRQRFPVPLLHMALFAESAGALRAAEMLYLKFIRESQGRIWEVFYNLGMIYYRQSSWENALDCFERYRFYKPSDPRIIQLIFDCRKKARKN
ncbi:tetratricopeptide repeat protein, partial [bacterium]|nr:tetratricopeptide repeat protein [bacterium]